MRVLESVIGLLFMASGMSELAADTPSLSSCYGNTLEISGPGETGWIYIDSDGTWRGIFNGRFYVGKDWRLEGDLTCFNLQPTEQQPEPKPVCFHGLAGHGVGDKWESVSAGTGKVWQTRLIGGRRCPHDVAPASCPRGMD